jgi:hypothetical protein
LSQQAAALGTTVSDRTYLTREIQHESIPIH